MKKEHVLHTIESAKADVQKNIDEIMDSYRKCKEIPEFMRNAHLEELWKSGCWLKETLVRFGATEQQSTDICFAHGQRSVFGDPWKYAVAYANKWMEKMTIPEKPGPELANRINQEAFGEHA